MEQFQNQTFQICISPFISPATALVQELNIPGLLQQTTFLCYLSMTGLIQPPDRMILLKNKYNMIMVLLGLKFLSDTYQRTQIP